MPEKGHPKDKSLVGLIYQPTAIIERVKNMENQVQPPICAICGTTEQLLRCAKCKTIYYCSIAHQHIDWPSHKRECRLLAKQKNNNKMQLLQQAVAATTLNNTLPATMNGVVMTNGCGGIAAGNNELHTILPPLSVILGTNEQDILSSKADTVTQSTNNGFQDNVEANFATMEQMEFGEQPLPQQQGLPQLSPTLHPNQQYPQFSNSQNSQHEKSSSYQIGRGDEPIGNSNERRYEELCLNIINDMNQYGLSVVDDFLGMEKGLQILNEVHQMYAAGVFQDGQTVNNAKVEQDLRAIRGDKITWVKGVEPGCSNVGYLINQIDAVICRANTMKNNGKLGNYNIKERTKAMVACYPGSGSHYVMHVDNPNKDGRVITAIYYLNVNWDTKRSGGVLRIFPEHGDSVADIEPKFDRLIFFWSDKRNPHEVQPAHRTRYAITVWYFDAAEREAALNHTKYKNNLKTSTAHSTNANSNPNTNSSEICT